MRAVLQRVTHATVTVSGAVVGQIGEGLLVLLGITHEDGPAQVASMARKLHELRLLRDERSCAETGAGLLVVRRGRRPATAPGGRRPAPPPAATAA